MPAVRLFLLAVVFAFACLNGAALQSAAAPLSWEEKRLLRMKFDAMAAALGAREGHHIADLGAGDGIFTAALAGVVGPKGTVYAVEIDEEMLKRLRRRIADASLKNVEVIHAAEDDPKLPPASLDGVLLVDTYH